MTMQIMLIIYDNDTYDNRLPRYDNLLKLPRRFLKLMQKWCKT